MTICPKCQGTNVHSDRGHKAAHGLHQGIHVWHYLPIAGAVIAATSALGALFGTPHYYCGDCKYSF